MNPLTLRLENVGRFAEATIDLPEGTAALAGPNGSGKSTILNAIELALFATGSRDLAGCLGPNSDRLALELVFEHAGATYRVRRSYRAGKSTLDLELASGDSWTPLSRETTKATQQLISETLGLSRVTFNASAFLGQGRAGAFPDADPADRKAILAEILDPRGLWPKLAALATAERKAAETAAQIAQAKITEREQRVAALPGLTAQVAALEDCESHARIDANLAEAALEAAQATLAAAATQAEKIRTLTVQHDHARHTLAQADTAVAEARQAAGELPAAQSELYALTAQSARLPELEAKLEEQRQARAERDAAVERKRHAEETCDRLRGDADRLVAEYTEFGGRLDAAEARLTHLHHAGAGVERCDRCEQILGTEAHTASITNLTVEAAKLNDVKAAKATAVEAAEAAWAGARGALSAIVVPVVEEGTFGLDLQAARAAAQKQPFAAAKVDRLAEQAARLPDLAGDALSALALAEDAGDALTAAKDGAADSDTLKQHVTVARRAVEVARAVLDTAAAELTRTRQSIEHLQEVEQEIAALAEETRETNEQLDLLRVAERAYGRDGIPVLIVENVLPQIESEANRILDLMPTAKGETLRLELHTQAEKRDGALRETLDIVVVDQFGGRPFESYSGGEQGRLNVALRLSLSRLLTTRRGAESRVLVLDEVPYLDELGQEQLVDVIASLAGVYDRVLTVNHSPNVADRFEQVIAVESDTRGLSRIVGARDAVSA